MKYKVTLKIEEIVEASGPKMAEQTFKDNFEIQDIRYGAYSVVPVTQKELINSLEYWARMFREELLSDQFGEDIANVLADRAHDLRLEQEDA